MNTNATAHEEKGSYIPAVLLIAFFFGVLIVHRWRESNSKEEQYHEASQSAARAIAEAERVKDAADLAAKQRMVDRARAENEAEESPPPSPILLRTAEIAANLRKEIEEQSIPGMMPVDIYLNLEEKGFTTKKAFGNEQNEFVCTHTVNQVQCSATVLTPPAVASKVKEVKAMAQYFGGDSSATDSRCAEFLGYVATVKYSGATPDQARAWVNANMGKKVEKVFGSVKFELFTISGTRMLRLSKAP